MTPPDPRLCPVTAVFPTRGRLDKALATLQIIHDCSPRPAEVIVHVDGDPEASVEQIREKWPAVRVLHSATPIGPGGGRNRLVTEATHELVANFDDDSFPASPDYFARVLATAGRFPDAAMLSAASQEREWNSPEFLGIACPSGCGCVFRRSWFLRTGGFVPMPIAFNMEEVDLGLQLHAIGGVIVQDPGLKVTHIHSPSDSAASLLRTTVLANTALLPFLRYPIALWPCGLVHVVSQTMNYLRRGWGRDVLPGLCSIPRHLWLHRCQRRTVPARAVLSWLKLRRHPLALGPAEAPA